jgi:transcriptional regulator with XRE-family HTH domain
VTIEQIMLFLRNSREEAGMTKAEIATAAGMTTTALAEAEHGGKEITAKRLSKWARSLGMELTLSVDERTAQQHYAELVDKARRVHAQRLAAAAKNGSEL